MTTTPLTITESARALGVSTKTVRRLIEQRKLGHTRYTERGRVYIDRRGDEEGNRRMEMAKNEKSQGARSDDWIIEHAAELKRELLALAKAGKPKPKAGTTLGRALKLFTTPVR